MIDKVLCTNCGLGEKVCQMDVFRSRDGVMTLAYQQDCCNCLECKYVCPVDAISFVLGEPKKYNMTQEWKRMKKIMGIEETQPISQQERKRV